MQVFLSPVTGQAFTNETDIVEFKCTQYLYTKIAQNDHPMYLFSHAGNFPEEYISESSYLIKCTYLYYTRSANFYFEFLYSNYRSSFTFLALSGLFSLAPGCK